MTLLSKAHQIKRKQKLPITNEHIELVLALTKNEIGMSQACKVLKIKKHSSVVYSWLFRALKHGVKKGKINIHKTNLLY